MGKSGKFNKFATKPLNRRGGNIDYDLLATTTAYEGGDSVMNQ
jgi:hypothetical protein